MVAFGHRHKQMNPLQGMLYIALCGLFGYAMYKLGIGACGSLLEDKILSVVFFAAAICVWALGFILLWDLMKYFRSN